MQARTRRGVIDPGVSATAFT